MVRGLYATDYDEMSKVDIHLWQRAMKGELELILSSNIVWVLIEVLKGIKSITVNWSTKGRQK